MTEESRPYIHKEKKELKEKKSSLKAQVRTSKGLTEAGLMFSTLGGIASVATFTAFAAPFAGILAGVLATASLVGSVKVTMEAQEYIDEIKAIKKELKIRKHEDMLAKRKEKLERRRKFRKQRRNEQKDFGDLTIASIEREIDATLKADLKAETKAGLVEKKPKQLPAPKNKK